MAAAISGHAKASSQQEELQAEGEGLKGTFERIEFLVKQGILSETAAARKKQDVIDTFCLAPMVERRRLVQQQQLRQEQEHARYAGLLGGGATSFLSVTGGFSPPPSPPPFVGGGSSLPRVPPIEGRGLDVEQSAVAGLADPEMQQVQGMEAHTNQTRHECARAGCHLSPTFGYEGRQARMCPQHRTDGMVDLTVASPAQDNDSLPSSVRHVAHSIESPAASLAPPVTGDSDTPSTSTVSSGCGSLEEAGGRASSATSPTAPPSHGGSGISHPALCAAPALNEERLVPEAEHAPATVPDAADLKRGTCEWPKCQKEPHYALRGQRARTCFTHKKEDWVHVSRRRCDREGCARGAYFSLEGSSALFCSAHRTPTMVDVVNMRRYRCDTAGCLRQAYYNYPGLSRAKAIFCSTHKRPDMINVRHRLCESEGCGTTPTYSFPGSRPRFCASHKEAGMVDTKSKMCAFVELDGSNCTRCRLYGEPEGKATFCLAHKKDGMVNIRQAKKRKR